MVGWNRRDLLRSTALLALSAGAAKTGVIGRGLPWSPYAGAPPTPVQPGGWLFFSPAEAAAVEAMADRIIPPDPDPPGGKDAGCAVFIDRQLAGPYGRREGLYVQPPFLTGAKSQGPQNPNGPAARYRAGLQGLETLCQNHFSKSFAQLSAEQQDQVLSGLEDGSMREAGADKDFFDMVVKDVQQGFFADPLYGGNRDMAGWRLIGFPGARYDYRDWVERHNERYPQPPVGIMGRAEWMPKGG